MGPSRRDQRALWIAGIRFCDEDREASEGAMVEPWSGGVNVGAQGHDAGHLSLLV